MTLLETAQGLEEEQFNAWLETLTPEEKIEFIVQTLEAWMDILDQLVEATDGEISRDA